MDNLEYRRVVRVAHLGADNKKQEEVCEVSVVVRPLLSSNLTEQQLLQIVKTVVSSINSGSERPATAEGSCGSTGNEVTLSNPTQVPWTRPFSARPVEINNVGSHVHVDTLLVIEDEQRANANQGLDATEDIIHADRPRKENTLESNRLGRDREVCVQEKEFQDDELLSCQRLEGSTSMLNIGSMGKLRSHAGITLSRSSADAGGEGLRRGRKGASLSTLKSCEFCSLKKMKCDAKLPCKACLTRNQICEYRQRKSRLPRGKRSFSPPKIIKRAGPPYVPAAVASKPVVSSPTIGLLPQSTYSRGGSTSALAIGLRERREGGLAASVQEFASREQFAETDPRAYFHRRVLDTEVMNREDHAVLTNDSAPGASLPLRDGTSVPRSDVIRTRLSGKAAIHPSPRTRQQARGQTENVSGHRDVNEESMELSLPRYRGGHPSLSHSHYSHQSLPAEAIDMADREVAALTEMTPTLMWSVKDENPPIVSGHMTGAPEEDSGGGRARPSPQRTIGVEDGPPTSHHTFSSIAAFEPVDRSAMTPRTRQKEHQRSTKHEREESVERDDIWEGEQYQDQTRHLQQSNDESERSDHQRGVQWQFSNPSSAGSTSPSSFILSFPTTQDMNENVNTFRARELITDANDNGLRVEISFLDPWRRLDSMNASNQG
ncbi:Zn(2)-C6 fungal-type DNA-binding domain protein [Nannochloropsis gaditana]|uniref:Zn(2)-C6 fungal-type DNA-binding domain protein n=1 Tax=Nannochloropsis gaditana TaxID=72520 RepID=W7T165_9STRA|nr:Zn(2)-C6 fungal-type DNA-binding domain protein [Nannochloropsis gaditana]